MSQPTTTSPLNSPSHSSLHNFHINAKMFGATGNGSTDDTTAIQNAIDATASTGNEVFLPSGTYILSSALEVNSTTLLSGKGAVLSHSGGSVISITNNTNFFRAKGIKFTGSTKAFSLDGPGYLTQSTFEDCQFVSNAGAVYAGPTGQAYSLRFKDCTFIGNTGDVVFFEDDSKVNNITFENCWWQGSGSGTEASSYVRIDSDTGGQISDVLFQRCTFEGPATSDLIAPCRLGSINRIEFNSCHWADFQGTAFTVPIFLLGTAVNAQPAEFVMIACSVHNGDGAILKHNSATPLAQVTFIGCDLQSDGNPFTITSGTPNRITFIGSTLNVAQSTWGSSSVTYIQCKEAGSTVAFRTTGKVLTTAGIGVGNSAAATNLGSVTDKIEVFDETGSSLGYLPVYDAIT